MALTSYMLFVNVDFFLMARFSGGIYSPQNVDVSTTIGKYFVNNAAIVDAGAVHVTGPNDFNMNGVKFTSNKAVSGGAVKFESTEKSYGEFNYCQFYDNSAFLGGGMYLDSGGGNVSVHQSEFRNNIAGENPPIDLISCWSGRSLIHR